MSERLSQHDVASETVGVWDLYHLPTLEAKDAFVTRAERVVESVFTEYEAKNGPLPRDIQVELGAALAVEFGAELHEERLNATRHTLIDTLRACYPDYGDAVSFPIVWRESGSIRKRIHPRLRNHVSRLDRRVRGYWKLPFVGTSKPRIKLIRAQGGAK